MIMPPRLRKFVLTVHVVASVGWLGAVVTFVAVALVALSGEDTPTVRGALLLMEPIGWYVLLPLAVTSASTGILQGLAGTWGAVRHYWVLFKLVIGTVSVYVLLMFLLTTVGPVTSGAADPASSLRELRALAGTPRDHALLALAGLLTATVLAIYKPRAPTRYGRRHLDSRRGPRATATEPRPGLRWAKVAGFVLGVLAWAVLVRLTLGSGPAGGGGHGPAPGGDTPGVTREQPSPENRPGHTPPPGIPTHGGG